MHWNNIPTALLRKARFIQATNEQLGIWLRLLSYCHEQENNGTIECCTDWSDKTWAQTAGVTAADVNQKSPIWHFSGLNLCVSDYPRDLQYKLEKIRRGNVKGGSKRTPLKRIAARNNGQKGGRPKVIPINVSA